MRPRASSSISPDASFQRLNGRHGVAGVPRLRRMRSRGRWTRCGRLRRCARCARVLRGGSRLGRWRRDSPGLRFQRPRFRSLETPRASDRRSRRIADQGAGNGADRSEDQRARHRPQSRISGPLLGRCGHGRGRNHRDDRDCQHSSHDGPPPPKPEGESLITATRWLHADHVKAIKRRQGGGSRNANSSGCWRA
jgi:hypothetical protein